MQDILKLAQPLIQLTLLWWLGIVLCENIFYSWINIGEMLSSYLVIFSGLSLICTCIILFIQYNINNEYEKLMNFFSKAKKSFMKKHNNLMDPLAKNAFETPLGKFISSHFDNLSGIINPEEILKQRKVELGVVLFYIMIALSGFEYLTTIWVFGYSMSIIATLALAIIPMTVILMIILVNCILQYKTIKGYKNTLFDIFDNLSPQNQLQARDSVLEYFNVTTIKSLEEKIDNV